MELMEYLKPKIIGKRKFRLAVACAADHDVLSAVFMALNEKDIEATLVGDQMIIESLIYKYKYDINLCEIIDEKDNIKACEVAVRLVSEHKADFLMKGLVDTSILLKAVLNKEWGLRTGNVLSHVAIFSLNHEERIYAITDGAMNIAPNLDQKRQIIENAIDLMHRLGKDVVNVACLAAVEKVNPKMEATLDALALSEMKWDDAFVDGPFALDNAVSIEAAKHKGIQNDQAGKADVLFVPDIEAGNILYKAVSFLAHASVAACIAGASAPIVLTSRADSDQSKYNSILMALALIKEI